MSYEKQLRKRSLEWLAANPFEFTPDDEAAMTARPKTRAECANVPRPCPYVSCRYNMALDVTETGLLQQHKDVDDMPPSQSCALDIADTERSEKETAQILGVTEQRVGQIVRCAINRLKHSRKLVELWQP